jgi:ABC-type tungstate transport system substrate-binding protein
MVREVGVLLLVFGPLDYLVEYSRNGFSLNVRHGTVISGCASAGIVLMAIGVEIERR